MLQNINLILSSGWVNFCQNGSLIRKFCNLDLDEIGGQCVNLCTFQIWVVNLPGLGGSTSRHLLSQLRRNQHHSNQIGLFDRARYRRFRLPRRMKSLGVQQRFHDLCCAHLRGVGGKLSCCVQYSFFNHIFLLLSNAHYNQQPFPI